MKNSVRRNVRLCAAVFGVAALGLSACSGGDDDDSMSSVTGGTTSMSATMQKPEQAPASVADLALAAYAAGDAVEKAATDEMKRAGDNLADAQSAAAVGGSSAAAAEAAQMVLAAHAALETAIMAAKDARDAAQARHDADGTTEEEKANLVAAIEDVNEGITTAEASLQTIDGNVMTIRGTDAEDPNEPADWGTRTAEAIQDLLEPDDLVPTNAATLDAAASASEITSNDNAVGMTWNEVLGGTVITRQIRTNVSGRTVSIAGKMARDFVNTADQNDMPLTDVEATERSSSSASGLSVNYRGVAGMVYCSTGTGQDCGAPVNGVLGAGWYFVPANRDLRYVKAPGAAAADPYVTEVYAEYGYWLRATSASDDTPLVTFFRRTVPASDAATFYVAAAANEDNKAAVSAEYSGEAIGLSYRGTPVREGVEATSSGHFTATVNLTATFSGGTGPAEAQLSGSVSNFQGDAVDPSWRVTLNRATLPDSGTVDAASTVAVGDNNSAGTWNAQAFGRVANRRPEGFMGGFNAQFNNGRAVGVFATDKQ